MEPSKATVERVVRLGFEVRVDLVDEAGERLSAEITRRDDERLALTAGDVVYVRPVRALPPEEAFPALAM